MNYLEQAVTYRSEVRGSAAIRPGAGDADIAMPATIVTFTALTSGIGRTSAVANVAWILAAAGKRVLIADWSTEAASVDAYLAPFYIDTVRYNEQIRAAITSLVASGWGTGTGALGHFDYLISKGTRRYALPESAGHIDLISHSATGQPYRPVPPLPDDEVKVAKLREAVRSLNYDYVLVDAPTDTSDLTVLSVARFTDVAVICFTLRRQSISNAAAEARRIRDRARHALRFVITAAQVDDRDDQRVSQSRAALRDAFAEFLADGEHGGAAAAVTAEIPYEPYDAYDERLATLIDDPADKMSLLHAYERLTSAITGGDVAALPTVPAAVRARYRHAFGAGYARDREQMFIAYAVEDRLWADWIRSQLEPAGVDVRSLPARSPMPAIPGAPILAVLSPHFAGVSADESGGPAAGLATVVGIRVSDMPLSVAMAALEKINFAECDEARARARLLSYFSLIAPPPAPGRMIPRYPRSDEVRARTLSRPTRNPSFVGREKELEELRDWLTTRSGPYVLRGPGGVGKSEMAREYTHRFALDYDILWWIPADDERAARISLAGLAAELVDPVPETGDAIEAVLAELSANPEYSRYLLVYDDADDPAALDGLLPRGSGHVLVTTRAAAGWPTAADVSAFTEAESVMFLRRNMPQASDQDLRRIAHAVDRLPFSLHLAGAWVRQNAAWLRERGSTISESVEWSAAEFVARLGQQMARSRQEPSASPHAEQGLAPLPASAAAAVTVTFATLADEERGRLAIRLLELCAFLSPDGIARWLLCSPPMLAELISAAGSDGHALAADALMLHQVLWKAVSFGLAEVDWGRRASLRMHHMLQELVRRSLSPAGGEARRTAVLRALAAAAPTEADDSAASHEGVFEELQRHFVPSGAARSQDPAVRRWVVNQVRYLCESGDAETWRSALRTVTGLLKGWTATFGPDDELRLRLAGHAARLLRALGDNEAALPLVEDALSRQRRSVGLLHPRTLMSGRGRAADLRGLGRFAEALAEDQATWSGYREVFGDDHPDTLMAGNNLALSSFLTGDHRAALSFGQEVYDRRLRLFGPDDPAVLWVACNVGSYRREVGQLHGAQEILRDTLQRIRQHHPRRLLDELRTTKALAVAELRLAQDSAAQEHSLGALHGYAEALGEDHPDTLSAELCRAAVLYAGRQPVAAVELAMTCLRGYRAVMGDEHPFTSLCRVDLGLFLLAANEPARSVEATREGLEGLRRQCGDQHPWTIAAAINYACGLAVTGTLADALELGETTATDAREFLGPDHPYTVRAYESRNAARAAASGAAQELGQPPHWKGVDIDVPQT